MKNIIVVGGGASGMMAAVAASSAGGRVTLLERNEKLGKKIYITGKGRGNLTNDCEIEDFLDNVFENRSFA
ncbi:MAG: NAD(P)/FAD-dependent oxidoreductase, partial [Eubacteriaceae bacterium]|nr:NAD(P)/FAD-dependent oxidoreductase [Eubacteriaceae bacterium]